MTTQTQARKRDHIIETLSATFTEGEQDLHRQKFCEVKATILDMLRRYPDDFDWAIRRCFDFKRSAYYQSVNDRERPEIRAEYAAAYAAWQAFTPLIYYWYDLELCREGRDGEAAKSWQLLSSTAAGS